MKYHCVIMCFRKQSIQQWGNKRAAEFWECYLPSDFRRPQTDSYHLKTTPVNLNFSVQFYAREVLNAYNC